MSIKYVRLWPLILLALLSLNCGGGSSKTSTSSTAPGSSSPPSSSSPGVGSGDGSSSTGGGSSSGTGIPVSDNYMATVFAVRSDGSTGSNSSPTPPALGAVVVDATANDGKGTLQIGGGVANSSYALYFCGAGAPSATGDCFQITSYATDASGSANLSFQIPASAAGTLGSSGGRFSGAFFVFKDGVPQFGGGENTSVSGASFRASMLPVADTNGSGTVLVTGQTAHFTVTGAKPNASFQTIECAVGGGCDAITLLTTDDKGNGTVDLTLPVHAVVSYFRLQGAGTGYQSAFRVQ